MQYGSGIAGYFGRRLSKKLGIPVGSPVVPLKVTIAHHPDYLLWSRKFGDANQMESSFIPLGHYPDGHWLEETSGVKVTLGVEIVDGGWKWHQRKARVMGISIPGWLVPKVAAGKSIVSGKYQFDVSIHHPWLGFLLSYHGLLDVVPVDT